MDLKGKHIFVTGGVKRIGRALAEQFLTEKARVTVTYATSEKEAKEFQRANPDLFAVKAALEKTDEIREAVTAAVKKNGPIDVLINCASQFFPTPVLQCSEEQWDLLIDTNLKGQFFFAQSVAKEMLQANGGVIINIVDVNAEHPLKNFAPYTASKAGLLMLTKSLAQEWAPKIRVCSISPGPILMPENFTKEQTERAVNTTLLKRLGSPKDIVEGVLFLIRGTYLTGFNLVVDGGYAG